MHPVSSLPRRNKLANPEKQQGFALNSFSDFWLTAISLWNLHPQLNVIFFLGWFESYQEN
jgi:hypothetical protein